MEFVERYFRNLAIFAIVVAGLWALLKIFYPAALDRIASMELFFGGVRLWPLLLVLLLLLALPLRKP